MKNLREQMKELVHSIQVHVKDGMEHQEICQRMADDYDLYHRDHFPIWLSRVVEGVQRDMGEGQKGE